MKTQKTKSLKEAYQDLFLENSQLKKDLAKIKEIALFWERRYENQKKENTV